MSLWRVWLLGVMLSLVTPAVNADFSEVCEYASCHQPREIQQHTALMQRKQERQVMAARESGAGPGTVRLLLSEMEGLAQRKGIDGLDPEEVEHIQTIKGLIADTIIPSILAGAEESRQEIAELYAAMMNCSERATGELDVESTLHTTVEQHKDDHKECREREDRIIKEKDRVCQQFNITTTSIQLPAGEMPGLEANDATMIQYLKTMDEYFCGRMDTFKDEWDECEDLKDNLTTTNNECTNHQKDLEETWCLWRTELEGTCEGFAACWNSSVSRFYERKTAIEKLVDDRRDALEGAMRVQCLWDAWEWDREPCTVNETKVKQCKELQPNTSSIEVDIPSPPPPLPCDTSEAGYFPCTEVYIASEYGSLDVSQALIDEMRAQCSACPPSITKEDSKYPGLVEIPGDQLYVQNGEYVEGHTYRSGQSSGGFTISVPQDAVIVSVTRIDGTIFFEEGVFRFTLPDGGEGVVEIEWEERNWAGAMSISPRSAMTQHYGSYDIDFGSVGDTATMDWRGETMEFTIDGNLVADGPNIVKDLELTVEVDEIATMIDRPFLIDVTAWRFP